MPKDSKRANNLREVLKQLRGADTWAKAVGAGDSISAAVSVAETRLAREEEAK